VHEGHTGVAWAFCPLEQPYPMQNVDLWTPTEQEQQVRFLLEGDSGGE
jgi:hypothetical protein